MDSELCLIEESVNVHYSCWVREALDELADNFTVTDPSISGHPIVYASKGFLKMSGYSKAEVIGRNGRMFQGPETNRRSVMEIREAIREVRAIQINLLNYRKDGTPFWMLFHMSPVFSKVDGRVMHFVAVQVPIRKRRCLDRGFVRNGVGLLEDVSTLQEITYGSCRRELHSDCSVELGRVLTRDITLDSEIGALEIGESCEASDVEKEKAATTINTILSVLMQYSESTDRLACRDRWSFPVKELIGPSFTISLGRIKQSFVLFDPHSSGIPIVYASNAFLRLTGYARHEILGQNCKILSGADTDHLTLQQIDDCIKNESTCTVRILNYRKDKSSFWNLHHITPVRNASGKVAYFVGVHLEDRCNNEEGQGLSFYMRQCSVVAAVRVALRSSSMGAGPSIA